MLLQFWIVYIQFTQNYLSIVQDKIYEICATHLQNFFYDVEYEEQDNDTLA